MNKKIRVLIIGIVIIVVLSCIIFMNKKSTENESENETFSVEQQQINELKQQLGITGKNDIYAVSEEYDGRKVLTIKPEIQYSTVMAGIIKESEPEYSEIEELLKKAPNTTGIWVSEKSREKFLKILELVTNAKYKIDEKGFLEKQELSKNNKYDEKINNIISSNKLYVIDINSTCYILDDVTGDVVEYPFEEMDPYIPFEYFETGNKSIFVITSNSSNKISYEDAIKEILENINL